MNLEEIEPGVEFLKEGEDVLITLLRAELNLGDMHITNAQLLRATEGSFLRAKIELVIELSKFKNEILNAILRRG